MTRKNFLFLQEKLSYQFQMHFKLFVVYLSVLFSGELAQAENKSKKIKPNILFIAVDDLNDWVGCLGGHPQAKTPNIDAFAKQGVLFEEAYCAAPLCSPSRTAIMTGLRPSTTGIYGNLNWFRDLPKYKDWVTLPQYFRNHGYYAVSGGKLFHQPKGKFSDPISWDHQYSLGQGTPRPKMSRRYTHGLKEKFSNQILARLIDWEALEQPKEQSADWKAADGAADFLIRNHDNPFFLACGIYLPHLPWHVPKKYFDLHPIEKIKLPKHQINDIDDIPPGGRRMIGDAAKIIRESGKWREAVQGCLAAGSFADDCVGHVLSALNKSAYRDNTIVVLWGDHGYDICEKTFAKSALWQQTTRTPLIVHVPEKLGGNQRNANCKKPVSLIDLYPTLIELCGLPKNSKVEGRSIAPLIFDPQMEWPYPALITHSPHWHGTNHAVRSEQYHYIKYSKGGEELYDMYNDPDQLNNLANEKNLFSIKEELKKWMPRINISHVRPKK